MKFWKSLSGILSVEFTSPVPERTLDAIVLEKIPISKVAQKDELTYRMQIQRKDYHSLSGLLQKRGDQLKIIKKIGLYWSLKSLLHRPLLLSTFLLLLLSSLYLPTRIFFITVEGNTTIPDRLILSAAEDCGIRFAAARKHVRSEKVKNSLLSAVPGLQWAGINTSGCTAVISVRERTEEEAFPDTNVVSNLISDIDGYILSATATNGTAHVSPGDAVTKGQLLISGYTDCGIYIRASRAEGEILAQTNRKISAVMPNGYSFPEKALKPKYQIGLIIRKKRINLWKDSRISDASCGRMYEEYYVSLPGGFQLPVAISVDQYLDYRLLPATIPEAEAHKQLQKFSQDYIAQQMIAGQIIRKQQHLSCSEQLYRMESSFICTEMIGMEQREQIGVSNGKRN